MSGSARTKVITLGVLAAVFGAGSVVGAAFDRSLGATTPDPDEMSLVAAGSESESSEDRPRRQAMWERVGPDDGQRAVIDSIIAYHRSSMESLQAEFREAYNPRYWSIVDSTRSSIREVLEGDQRMQYDSLTSAYDERRRNRDESDRGN